MSSANAEEQALFAADGTVSFSWYFWTNFLAGEKFYDAYTNAKSAINLSYPQKYQIDTDGDGIPDQKNDRLIAQNIKIGDENTSAGSPPSIGEVSDHQYLAPTEHTALIYAWGITSETGIARVYAVITPPDVSGGSPEDPILDLPELDLLPVPGADPVRYENTYDQFNTDFHSRYKRQNSTLIKRSRLSPQFYRKAMEL